MTALSKIVAFSYNLTWYSKQKVINHRWLERIFTNSSKEKQTGKEAESSQMPNTKAKRTATTRTNRKNSKVQNNKLLLRPRNQPMQDRVQIRLLLRADPIATHLPVLNRLQVHRLDQLIDG